VSISRKALALLQRDVLLFVTNLITGAVVARRLGPEMLGSWVVLQVIPTYAEAFGRLKTDVAAIYFLGKGKYSLSEIVMAINTIAIATSAIYVGVGVWRADWVYHLLFRRSTGDVHPYMYLMFAQVPLLFLYMNYVYLHIAREDVTAYNRMTVLRSLLSSAMGIGLLVFTHFGLGAVVFSTSFSLFVGLVYGVVRLGNTGPRQVPSVALFRDLVSYASKLYAAGITAYVNSYTSQLISVVYLLPAQVGFLGMAQSQVQLLTKAPEALGLILFPRIVRADSPSAATALAARAFRVMLALLIGGAVVAAIAIRPAISLVYGSQYLPSVVAFWILLPGIVASSASTALLQYFQGIDRADLAPKIAIVPVVLQVGLAPLLIPAIGLAGAAMAVSVGSIVVAAVTIVVFIRVSGLASATDLIPGREDVQLLFGLVATTIRRYLKKSATST
jgi:O-antigen/teichoic acid export membrane protein